MSDIINNLYGDIIYYLVDTRIISIQFPDGFFNYSNYSILNIETFSQINNCTCQILVEAFRKKEYFESKFSKRILSPWFYG